MILVFSKQKGITVVFRNDPLESLKVSSTFDSIPFVRDFLQREIEAQLRILFMDELPAIIHRLSLRLWVPEYRAGEEIQSQADHVAAVEGPGSDPLASPPQDPVDSMGNVLSESQIASLSLDSSVEAHSLFSRKNLLRLGALTDSQRTLSLFTPSIHEVVYRAWTSPSDQADLVGGGGVLSPMSPGLSRAQSQVGGLSSLQDNASVASAHTRSSASTHAFSSYGLSLGAGRHSKSHARKRKKRVVDLRRPKNPEDTASASDDSAYSELTSTPSVCSAPLPAVREQADDPVTPPLSPESDQLLPVIPERHRSSLSYLREPEGASSASQPRLGDVDVTPRATTHALNRRRDSEKRDPGPSRELPSAALPFTEEKPSSSSVDPALVEKLAGEIARRMRDENLLPTSGTCGGAFWGRTNSPEETPPPAYGQ